MAARSKAQPIDQGGMNNVCYENDPFHDPRDVTLTSRMALSEVVVIGNVMVVVIYGLGFLPQ